MEAAAEWKSFTNSSSLNRLKSLSGNNANNNNNNDTIGQNNLTSQLNNIHSTSHINNSQLSHYNTSSILRTEKSYINNSYTSGNILSSSSGSQNTENITTTQSLCSPVYFLASSALPNLDEICRSSGLPVPSEVDITAENSSGKNRLKTDSSTDTLMNEDVITFCRLYALSAGYMLDAVINLDFTAIETVWKAFWCTEEIRDSRLKQSLSQEQLFSLVSDPAILQFVRLYDHTFYQSLAEVLIPNVLRPIPPSLTQTIRNFAKSLEGWMRQATQGLDSALVGLKVSAVSALAQTLRRYTSLNHLAQAARAVLKNVNQINQMLADLNRVDFNNVHEQASWVCQCSDATVSQLEHDFKRILQKHASLEEWAQWLDTVVTSILQPLEGNSLAYTRAAHQLVLKWSFYSSMVIRDLTLRSASSFGSFHLIRLLYDEYIFYLVEHKVAAHLGMTPVAVMGEMGRDITQQYFAQTRLHCDLINRRDPVKSSKDDLNSSSIKCSNPINSPQQYDSSYTSISLNIIKEGNNNDHGDHVDAGGGGGGGVDDNDNDDHHVNQSVEHRIDNITDIEDVDNNNNDDDDDFDEEIDEYVDDEEDVDDSLGDENAMLKEAHASAQAYCRNSTNSIFQSLNTSSSNTIEYKLEIIQQTNVDNNEKDIDNGLLIHSTENTTEKDTTQKKDNNNDKMMIMMMLMRGET
ncbi:unnamed protein product [Heterobilharzia americana]|nr:unnamed protein product [Heterobilharzia americana]